MEHRRLRKSTIYLLYSIGFVLLVGVAYLIEGAFTHRLDDDTTYVNGTIIDSEVKPVVTDEVVLERPYKNEEIKILKNYYDYKADENSQINAIMTYKNTYMQSSGICYGGIEDFDIVAILDGKVTNVKEDEILGNIVEIEHDNNIISVYQSLKDINVKIGDKISKGDIIGKAGTSNLNKDLNNHLYFELIVNGQIVNPEEYFGKTLNEIKA